MKDDAVYLAHIRDAIGKIESFTADMDAVQFSEDQKTQSAVLMQLAVIGEMVKRISPATKATIDAPWKEIAGFRDRAIHDYFDVDLDIVWQTVASDVPDLKKRLKR